jgi:hypothetical protein
VARFKVSVPQRDFSRGVVRPEFLEADDDETRLKSLQSAQNVRSIAGKILVDRFGTLKKAVLNTNALTCFKEIEPVEGSPFLIVAGSTRLDIYDISATLVQSFTGAPWTTNPWIVPARENTYIGGGSHEIYVLNYDGSTWTMGAMAFDESPGGHLAQPYYAFNKGVTITPSALSGTGITVTASSAVFTSDYVGLRLRYHSKEITITSFTSSTVLVGTVVSELPPSFDVVVVDASGFESGEIVVGATSGFTGLVTGVNTGTNTLNIVTISHFEGPDTSPVEDLAGPNTVSEVATVTAASSPYASIQWEEPLLSDVRGYPRSATLVGGKLVLADFASVPDIVAISSARSLQDFEIGLDDDDAIVRTVGKGNTRVRHVVDAGDLLILTDSGIYFVLARDGVEITPSNFVAVEFDERGANGVVPKLVESTVIFVSESGEDLMGAVLDGNVYLKWTVIALSVDHASLVNSIASISEPPKTIKEDDRLVIITNGDGTLVAMRLNADISKPGFFPWNNTAVPVTLSPPVSGQFIGQFMAITPFNGAFWAITNRDLDGGTDEKYLEQFSSDAWMDFSEDHVGASVASLSAYNGAPISVRIGDNNIGTYDNYTDVEALILAGSASDTYQIGIAWETWVGPWPVEYINSPRIGMLRARTVRVAVSVRNTLAFEIKRNNTVSKVQAYSVGDDLSQPPPRKTKVYRFPVFGNRDHPVIEIGKTTPGPFELLAYTPEVQA